MKLKDHNNPAKVQEIITKVNRSGGIEYASRKMEALIKEALEMLSQEKESVYKDALIDLVTYSVERRK
ncbi:MAG: hypothetical protein B7C24_16800 [Bacteroidetes bacterium 4572_77]|nr:MAG: hypothetical protein B7C24_16800 [Bacteroidetes bacterium 4572_77]